MQNRKSIRPSRRVVIKGAAVAAAVASTGKALLAQDDSDESAPQDLSGKTYLLIHGAWHGGWCWRKVSDALKVRGARVVTPTLSGLGARGHRLDGTIGLDTHISDILSVIRFEDLRDIILVGHSYGGMVITGVADAAKDAISHIVYLDAALPQNGQSMITQGPPRPDAVIQQIEQALRGMAPDEIGMAAFPPSVLGIPEDHPDYGWVADRLTPHPLKTWLEPIALENGGSDGLPRTYIHCTDPVLPSASFGWHAEQVQADPSWAYHNLPTGHDAMVTAPEDVVSILSGIGSLIDAEA